MKRALLAVLLSASCLLPRDNPFDREDVPGRYKVRVSAPDGVLTVQFQPLQGAGLRGYRVYRENARGERVIVADLDPRTTMFVDESAADAAEAAKEAVGEADLWWRVAGYIDGGEGPLSRKDDNASTRALPDTDIEPPLPDYITGQSGIAVRVQVTSSAVAPDVTTRLFRYRFRGGDWTDPIVAGPLVLTGLLDGRYTLEAAAVDENGNVDLTPASTRFTYDFNVPEGTSCDPAVCSTGLFCVLEPVGKFCRRSCGGDGGMACPEGLHCRMASGLNGLGACVVVAQTEESCTDRLCTDGLACAQLVDGRALCGEPCSQSACADPSRACLGSGEPACLREARAGEACEAAACIDQYACDTVLANPRCSRVCPPQNTQYCAAPTICSDLPGSDLKVCR